MNFSRAKKITDTLEEKVDVRTITYKNYFIWPLLKYHLFYSLVKFSENNSSQTNNKQIPVNSFKPTVVSRIKFYFYQLYTVLIADWKNASYRSKLPSAVDFLFADVTNAEYVDVKSEKKYSRYITPYVELLNKNGKLLFINNYNENVRLDKYINPFYFPSKYLINKYNVWAFYKNKLKIQSTSISNIDSFFNHYKNEAYSSIISKEKIISDLLEIEQYEKFWLPILKKTKPKCVFLECYYGNNNYYGLITACKKMNIKSIDIQHGVSQAQMYVGWSKVPKKGYHFLPDYYWCWSEYDVKQLIQTRNGAQELQPILGGNFWLAENRKNLLTNESDLKISDRIKEKQYKKVILVTLQYSIPISTILLNAVEQSPDDWFWLVRFHPLDINDPGYREAYIKALKDKSNVDFENATKANLYNLLSFTNVHITHHSTVAIEAVTYKVPTILLGDVFKEIFKEFIESGNFFIANSCDEILSLISSDLKINISTYNYFKIHTDENITHRLLHEIAN